MHNKAEFKLKNKTPVVLKSISEYVTCTIDFRGETPSSPAPNIQKTTSGFSMILSGDKSNKQNTRPVSNKTEPNPPPYLTPQLLLAQNVLGWVFCDETLPRCVCDQLKWQLQGLGPIWKSQWLANVRLHRTPSQSIPPISMTVTSTRQPQSVLLLQAVARHLL